MLATRRSRSRCDASVKLTHYPPVVHQFGPGCVAPRSAAMAAMALSGTPISSKGKAKPQPSTRAIGSVAKPSTAPFRLPRHISTAASTSIYETRTSTPPTTMNPERPRSSTMFGFRALGRSLVSEHQRDGCPEWES